MKSVVTRSALLCALVVPFLLSGCATMKKSETEITSLKTQVADLETKVQRKDAEIESLRQALSKTTEDKYNSMKESTVSTQVPSSEQIQKALKNAGFYTGEVDGKIGTQTKKAVRAFQKANNLTADGKVGPKTWSILAQYEKK